MRHRYDPAGIVKHFTGGESHTATAPLDPTPSDQGPVASRVAELNRELESAAPLFLGSRRNDGGSKRHVEQRTDDATMRHTSQIAMSLREHEPHLGSAIVRRENFSSEKGVERCEMARGRRLVVVGCHESPSGW